MTALVITAVTILLGALPASFGFLFKVRREQQRSAKRVLYYLLEIRFVALQGQFSPEELKKTMLITLEKSLRRYDPTICYNEDTVPEDQLAGMLQLFENLSVIRPRSLPEKEVYYQALENLAHDYPVLAYQIRGNEYLSKISDVIKEYCDWYKELIHTEEDMPAAVKDAASDMAEKGIEKSGTDILNEIENDLKCLAKICGRASYQAAKSIIMKRPSFKPDPELMKEVDQAIDQYIGNIHKAVENGDLTEEELHAIGNPAKEPVNV